MPAFFSANIITISKNSLHLQQLNLQILYQQSQIVLHTSYYLYNFTCSTLHYIFVVPILCLQILLEKSPLRLLAVSFIGFSQRQICKTNIICIQKNTKNLYPWTGFCLVLKIYIFDADIPKYSFFSVRADVTYMQREYCCIQILLTQLKTRLIILTHKMYKQDVYTLKGCRKSITEPRASC